MKKRIRLIVLAALAIGLLSATAPAFAAQPERITAPASTADILELYRGAVERVRGGEAGYLRTDWQKLGGLKITGNAAVDQTCRDVILSYLTTEEDAEPLVSPRGTPEAANRLPACTLTDLSAVESASFEQFGDFYVLEIVFCEEDSPRSRERTVRGRRITPSTRGGRTRGSALTPLRGSGTSRRSKRRRRPRRGSSARATRRRSRLRGGRNPTAPWRSTGAGASRGNARSTTPSSAIRTSERTRGTPSGTPSGT